MSKRIIVATVAVLLTISGAAYAMFGQAMILGVKVTPSTPINGVCGSANGVETPSAPTSNLCSAGSASSVTGAGPWNWTCNGSNGGTNASCSAPLTGSGGSAPAPAQAAGFTTLAIDSDFTSAFYSNMGNWFDCGGASSPIWYSGWIGFDASRCDAFSMVADTAMGVPQVLRIQWFNSFAGTVKAAAMETTNGAATAGRMFTNYYAEAVLRTSTAQNFQYMDFWSTASFNASNLGDGGQVEWDGWENFGNWGTGIHSWNGPDNCNGHWCVSISGGIAPDANYHRFAWRVTGALNVGYTLCSYYEDVPFSSGLNQYICVDMSGSNADPHLGGGTVSSIPIFMMFNRDNVDLNPNPAELWIKSIRVWVCPSWTAAQLPVGGAEQCFTSSQNP